jgi:hypothetical protein
MKTTFKLVFLMVLLSAGLIVALPSSSSAVETRSQACSTFSTAQTNYQTAATKRLEAMNEDFAKRLSAINDRSSTIDPKVQAARDAATAKFNDAIATLKAQPDLTAVQQKAIDTYATQMQAAEKTRESAVDAARSAYRTELIKVVQQHQAALSIAVAAFQSSVSTAFTTAISNCADANAKTALKTDIASAKTTFASARESSIVTGQISQLMQARNTAIKNADATFAKAVASYSAALATVLGVDDLELSN